MERFGSSHKFVRVALPQRLLLTEAFVTVQSFHRFQLLFTVTQAAARALADQLRIETAGSGVRVLTVVADDLTDLPRCAVDPVEFAAGLAAGMVDAVVQTELDVTELSVRGIARPVRTERL